MTRRRQAASRGAWLGATGVLAFSFTLPATKLAVADLDPWFVASGRAAVAAALAAAVLVARGAAAPAAQQWRRLVLVAIGVVIGFPALTSLALRTSASSHGAVVVGLLPAATAVAAVLRAGERPGTRFWVAAIAGTVAVSGFTLGRSGGSLGAADGLLLGAVALCAVGYAEGATLARELGGARTICWALVLTAPLSVPAAAASAPAGWPGADALLGFAYVSTVSMFLGFFAWYAGLARGGVARVGQLQLAQPLLTLVWSAALLGERLDIWTLMTAAAVLASVALTQRARIGAANPPARRPRRTPAGQTDGLRTIAAHSPAEDIDCPSSPD